MTTTRLLPFVELATGPNPLGTVIWLHGLGASGWDFVSLVNDLCLPPAVPLRFIFPHAPEMPVTFYGSQIMPAWYDITLVDIVREPDVEGIKRSQAFIEDLIANENSRGISSEKIVIAGFSQGGAITLQTGLRYKERLAGLIALSTYLPMAETLASEASLANKTVPILMLHGTHDAVIPIAQGEESVAHLKSQGYKVQFESYSIEHVVGVEAFTPIASFLCRTYGIDLPSTWATNLQ
jgi:phospholipase/carboxylesterase